MKRIQSGFTSLLFILLVGMALTVATIGYVASIKTMQSSAVTTHAQTQAQMQTMVGYQVLSEFLKDSNVKVDTISTGTVNSTGQVINYQKPTSGCPTGTGNYCFDIIGESGGAKAILRALFKVTSSVSSSTNTGSIFAGGLEVQKSDTFKAATGQTVGIKTGGANAGIVTDNAGKTVDLSAGGINVTRFTGDIDIPSANDMRPFANWIFTKNSTGTAVCYKNNLHSGGTNIDTETQMKKGTDPNPDECPLIGHGLSLSGSTWTFDSSAANLAGIVWFDGNVILDLHATPNDFVNSVIATGSVTTNLIDKQKVFNSYASNHYLLTNVTDANIKARLLKVCPADNYPTQYCQPYNAGDRALLTSALVFTNNKLTYIKDTSTHPASLSNILFSTDTGFAMDAANKSTVNFYGNLIGSKAAGGTGKASGKITGEGVINISGNIVVTGNFVTEMQGSMSVVLGNADASGNSIPTTVKSVTPASISYQ
jgi:hypothetical protein